MRKACVSRFLTTTQWPFNFQLQKQSKSVVNLNLYSPQQKLGLTSPLTPILYSQRQCCGCLVNLHPYNNNGLHRSLVSVRHFVSAPQPDDSSDPLKPKAEEKLSLYQRFKAMYKDYWYVLLPVHLVTSAGWFGGFYYLASSGVDIVALLEGLGVSEKLITPLRNGHTTTGYIAISYALYKIATPLRYTVTLGGTTISINYLKRSGYIKPVPSREKLTQIYQDQKDMLKERGQTLKERGQSLKDSVMQSVKPSEHN